jgi:hypothetical protein
MHAKFHNYYVRFEFFTAVTLKNGVFWDVTPCGCCKNRRFGGTQRLLHPKRRFLQEARGVTSQETRFFITISSEILAVRMIRED